MWSLSSWSRRHRHWWSKEKPSSLTKDWETQPTKGWDPWITAPKGESNSISVRISRHQASTSHHWDTDNLPARARTTYTRPKNRSNQPSLILLSDLSDTGQILRTRWSWLSQRLSIQRHRRIGRYLALIKLNWTKSRSWQLKITKAHLDRYQPWQVALKLSLAHPEIKD